MKRYILLLLVAIGFVASNAQVPGMFYIQKSEGAFSSFFYSEVKSIQYSKTDLTCQPHEKYVTQIIETSDSLYRLPLKEVLFEAPADPPIENGITPGIMVDLGLSVKWASHNIGATSPEEYGGLYGWADPIGTNRSTNNADYPNATPPTNIAGTEYDIATAKWGKNWRMPTVEEYQELVDKCTWTWITYKFVNGMKVTGPNGNSIFLPAMGYRLGITCSDQDNMGCYWAGTLSNGNYAYRLRFDNTCESSMGYYNRLGGYSVRPIVFSYLSAITKDATNISDNSARCSGEVKGIEYNSEQCGFGVCYGTASDVSAITGTCVASSNTTSGDFSVNLTELKANTAYNYCTYIKNGDKYIYGKVNSFTTNGSFTYVDLGLSVKWASCNVGAGTSPENYGGYYTYEQAQAFITPTKEQQQELIDLCVWEWTALNGVNGMKVTGPNSNSIFLPAAGNRYDSSYNGQGRYGCYWSSTPHPNLDAYAYNLYISINGGRSVNHYSNYYEYSVRPVDKQTVTGKATDISENSATCSGEVKGIENVTGSYSFGICYGTTSDVSATTGTCITSSIATSGYFSVNLTGLKAKTTYYYRTYITYDGKYLCGETQSFTTNVEPYFYVDAWTNVIWAYGTAQEGKNNGFQYRKVADSEWITVPEEWITFKGGSISARILHAEPNTSYVVRAISDDLFGNEITAMTQGILEIPNASLDEWWLNGKVWDPWAQGGTSFWDTGNKGASTLGESNSIPSDETWNGQPGKSAMMQTKFVGIGMIGKLAAGNLFSGEFLRVDGTNGVLNFGKPFTGRPTRLKGYCKYKTSPINYTSIELSTLKDKPDTAIVYMALTDWDAPYEIRTNPKNRQLFDKNSPAVIAYGEVKYGSDINAFTEFEVNLEYRATNRVPKHIVIVCTSSKYGDYFTGGTESVFYLDHLWLEWDYK